MSEEKDFKPMMFKNVNTGEIIVTEFDQNDDKQRRECLRELGNMWTNHFGTATQTISARNQESNYVARATQKHSGWKDVLDNIKSNHTYAKWKD